MSENASWKLPWVGHCRCAQVSFRVTLPPLLSMACHCTGCQRMSASAFSLSLAVPTPGFEVLTGEPVVGGLHGASKHLFCGYCMTWLFTRPDGIDAFVNVRPTMLDDARWVAPFIETHTAEKLPWAVTGAVHSFAKLPAMSDYDGLIREYAVRGARPH